MSLSQYIQLLKKLERLREKLIRLENKSYTVRISELSDMPRGGGGSFDQMTDKVVKLNELRAQYDDVKQEVEKIEQNLKLNEIKLIRYRYIYKMKWKDIAKCLGVSVRQTIRIYDKIVEKF